MPETPLAERVRREPPAFRSATVTGRRERSPHLIRIELEGVELEGFPVPDVAASVRILLPSAAGSLAMPTWNGNEFLAADGRRPAIRTFTPVDVDPAAGRMAVDVVVHGESPAGAWARSVEPGTPAAVSGPGRGYEIDPDATRFLIAGDESAIPAMEQILAALGSNTEANVLIEVSAPTARLELVPHPGAHVTWCDLLPDRPHGSALVAAVAAAPIGPDTNVWVAGEASAVQQIRRSLFEMRDVARSRAVIRGYWKHGRAGTGD